MNPDLAKLHPYPFEKLRELKAGIIPAKDKSPIALSVGEPKHSPPEFVLEELIRRQAGFSAYPMTAGLVELREAISQWLTRRFSLKAVSVEQIIPVCGTREALFSFTQAVIDRQATNPTVISPNPFYQIYEGASLLAGANIIYLNCSDSNNFEPDCSQVSQQQWQDCQLVFLCSPGNPTGTLVKPETMTMLIELADKYDFIIASDECYSEIYQQEDSPPVGLLQVCAQLGRDDFARCVVFHSLSKRSNLPGLRSGFVAGDHTIIKRFLSYRTYHGCAMALPIQYASIKAWQDEQHVIENRRLYRQKFADFAKVLNGTWDLRPPEAAFYFWAKTPMDDLVFTRELFRQEHITLLPGQYLGRENKDVNPGAGYVRMALVASQEECLEAAQRIKHFICQNE